MSTHPWFLDTRYPVAGTALCLAFSLCTAHAHGDMPPPSAPELVLVEQTDPPAEGNRAFRLRDSAVANSSGYQYRNDIGYATDSLLDMQRNAQGERTRNIDPEQARRSYQRYLKSFETDIPEKFDTGLDVKKR